VYVLHRWRLGLDGAAYATLLSQATSALLLLAYCCWRDWKLRGSEEATWAGLSMQAFRGWGKFLRYALPSTALLCAEWWAYEVVIFMAGGLQVYLKVQACKGSACEHVAGVVQSFCDM
jgi:multidrug resistance protein, MATE family